MNLAGVACVGYARRAMSVEWDDDVDGVLGGDLTAALGYRTPAAGVVVMAIAPLGLRERAAGRVGFTTSLGLSKKLERIAHDPRVALAFHAREHGTSASSIYALVQGEARVVENPSGEEREQVLEHAISRLGPLRSGPFWRRWLREYYEVRVPVWVNAKRIVCWSDLGASGEAHVTGAALPTALPAPHAPPENGTDPRIGVDRAYARVRDNAHALLGFAGPDGYPVVLPVEATGAGADGIELVSSAHLPPGARRAGLLAHTYRPQLIGLEARQYTGWLEVGEHERALYAPHTETGFKAPPNKTLLLLANGLVAKRGVRAARRAGALPKSGTGSGGS